MVVVKSFSSRVFIDPGTSHMSLIPAAELKNCVHLSRDFGTFISVSDAVPHVITTLGLFAPTRILDLTNSWTVSSEQWKHLKSPTCISGCSEQIGVKQEVVRTRTCKSSAKAVLSFNEQERPAKKCVSLKKMARSPSPPSLLTNRNFVCVWSFVRIFKSDAVRTYMELYVPRNNRRIKRTNRFSSRVKLRNMGGI